MFTCPEDTGLFNPKLPGSSTSCTGRRPRRLRPANGNGLLGIIRAGDAGFMCQFNLHKTFSAPHGSIGPAAPPSA
jgi:glycine dehydrogenase subunit 2